MSICSFVISFCFVGLLDLRSEIVYALLVMSRVSFTTPLPSLHLCPNYICSHFYVLSQIVFEGSRVQSIICPQTISVIWWFFIEIILLWRIIGPHRPGLFCFFLCVFSCFRISEGVPFCTFSTLVFTPCFYRHCFEKDTIVCKPLVVQKGLTWCGGPHFSASLQAAILAYHKSSFDSIRRRRRKEEGEEEEKKTIKLVMRPTL